MKLNDNYVTCTVGDEYFLVCVDTSLFSGMVKCNETVASVVECLKEEVDEKTIIEHMLSLYAVEEKVIRTDVNSILNQLRDIGALDE